MRQRRTLRPWLAILILAFGVGLLVRHSLVRAQDNNTTTLRGQVAPDFSLSTADGKQMKLSDNKGHVVMVDFWATWCGPCKMSLPHVQQVSGDASLAKKGLVVYAVNAQETADTVNAFLKQNNYTFAVPLDSDGATMKAYMVQGIPTTVIVGKDGKIQDVFVGFGGEETANEIDTAVNKALSE